MRKRVSAFVVGVLTYCLANMVIVYAVLFLSNAVVRPSVDVGAPAQLAQALAVDLLLIGLFGVQHSAMARAGCKAMLRRFVAPALERSVYLLATVAVFALLFWQWRPIDVRLWSIDSSPAAALVWTLFALGWALVLYSTFLIDHFDMMGLRQVWLYLRGRPYVPVPFKERALYRYWRHPMMIGVLVAFWTTPQMTVGHLVFAAGMTLYILIGVTFEERDLLAQHGEPYLEYRRRVAMFLPVLRRRLQSRDRVPS